MTCEDLIRAIDKSNMENEAKAEIVEILQIRQFEEEQAGKGEKF